MDGEHDVTFEFGDGGNNDMEIDWMENELDIVIEDEIDDDENYHDASEYFGDEGFVYDRFQDMQDEMTWEWEGEEVVQDEPSNDVRSYIDHLDKEVFDGAGQTLREWLITILTGRQEHNCTDEYFEWQLRTQYTQLVHCQKNQYPYSNIHVFGAQDFGCQGFVGVGAPCMPLRGMLLAAHEPKRLASAWCRGIRGEGLQVPRVFRTPFQDAHPA